MTGDKVLAITLEFQRLAIILANQITEPRLSEPDAHAQFGSESPFQFLGESVDEFVGGCRGTGWLV